MTCPAAREYSGTRTVARKLALQALYRWQLNACPWQDLVQEFAEAEDMARADREYFRALIEGVWRARERARQRTSRRCADRQPAQLDPIEHAVLLIGLYELHRLPRGAVSRRHQRGGDARQALRRHRRPQVRECRARSRRARAAARRALSDAGAHAALGIRADRALLPQLRRAARRCGRSASAMMRRCSHCRRTASWWPPPIRWSSGVHFPHGSPPASHRASRAGGQSERSRGDGRAPGLGAARAHPAAGR